MIEKKLTNDTLNVVGDLMCFKSKQFIIEDLYTNEAIEYCNKNVLTYASGRFSDNELYLNYFKPILVLNFFLSKKGIKKVNLQKASLRLRLLFTDSSFKNIISGGRKDKIIFVAFLNFFKLLLTVPYVFYLFMKIVKTNDIEKSNYLCLVRTKAAIENAKKLGLNYHIESLSLDKSIYSYIGVIKRFLIFVKSLFSSIIILLDVFFSSLNNNKTNSFYCFLDFYSKRLLHTILYKNSLEFILKKHQIKNFYSFNNLDRFAFYEQYICKKNDIKLTCYPHGIEYGFQLPVCYTGDIFYTTSLKSENYLNNLYNVKKFIYNEELICKIFTRREKNIVSKTKLVFFTEPRESRVNHEIIINLKDVLKDSGIILYLKLHPKDDKLNYLKYELPFINSLDSALINNVCFARKSSTLLEAVYNNSSVAAILLNEKDRTFFKFFPSLQDDRINVFYLIKDLYFWILEQYKLKSN